MLPQRLPHSIRAATIKVQDQAMADSINMQLETNMQLESPVWMMFSYASSSEMRKSFQCRDPKYLMGFEDKPQVL